MLVLCCLCLGRPLWAETDISAILARAPILNPNLYLYPESSLVDRSASLDAPAGKHGFLTVKDGHFYFADGVRARFFGVNIAKDMVFISKPEVAQLSALFARAGVNLVRIHDIDEASGLLDPSKPGTLRADRLDILDYWVAKLREHGIYLCLDLNDYRTFHATEGVPAGEQLGRGAKPYAVFDQHLIELQEQYARQFLVEHVNPYTHVCYANDPTIAMLEIYDENGLFIRRDDWPNLVEPYRTVLQQQWNAWLRYRYGSTAALRSAWTNRNGGCALINGESLEQATVKLPVMTLLTDPPQGMESPLQAPVRVSDGALFAYDTQVNFLQTMEGALREMGVKIPITAVGAQDVMPDQLATASSVDYVGMNFYWDHPGWNAGKDWTLPAYFSQTNPLTDNLNYTFPAEIAESRMYNKPIVVRELGYCYPSPYRGVGMLESAAYGAFLDVDALILFTYDTGVDHRAIGYFDIHLDPLRWGLVSQASRLFLSGEVKPSRSTVGIGYSTVDSFIWRNYASPLYLLSMATNPCNFTDPALPHPFNLLVASGRSCGEKWTGNNLLLFANARGTDLRDQGVAEGMDVLEGYHIQPGREGTLPFTFHGFAYDAGVTKTVPATPSYALADLRAHNLLPVALTATDALGFIDPSKQVIGFRNLPESLAVRVALDALHDWYALPVSHADIDQNCWRTDTGQLTRDMNTSVLSIDTPTVQAMAGNLAIPGGTHTSQLTLSTTTPIGTLMAESLDGQPLATSNTLFVQMTSRANNTGLAIAAANDGPKPQRLTALGDPPIFTDGKPTSSATVVTLAGKPLISVAMQNGNWEYLVKPGHALLYLDTDGISVTLPARPRVVRFHSEHDVTELAPSGASFTAPPGTRLIEIVTDQQ
jgi:hypothetical protein